MRFSVSKQISEAVRHYGGYLIRCRHLLLLFLFLSNCRQHYYCPFWNIFTHCGGHTFSHAMHNIQSFSLIIKGFFSDAGCPGVSNHSYTFTGHASIHAPSATHISKSTVTSVPHIPNCPGGSIGPHTFIPSKAPVTCLFYLKFGSIGP